MNNPPDNPSWPMFDQELIEARLKQFRSDTDRLWSRNSQFIGRVLKAHFLLEFHVSRFLEAACPMIKDLDMVRLTFSQKISFLKQIEGPVFPFYAGVAAVNKLRNQVAHSLDESLTEEMLTPIRQDLIRISRSDEKSHKSAELLSQNGIELVENFTIIVSQFLAGTGAIIRDLQIKSLRATYQKKESI